MYNFDNKTILIVEDDFTSRELLKETLGGSNANLVFTDNGESVVELINQKEKIDLILMDLRLPSMNGYETTEHVKKISKIPVIMQTAYVISGGEQIALRAGCDDYMSKPINPFELLQKINKFLS